jgi:O-antigen ligase
MTFADRSHRAAAADSSPKRWISYFAFVLALAVVIARITTPDGLRDPWEISPGSPPVASSPGPGTALVMDLLACVPALLVFLRSVIDSQYPLLRRSSHILLFALTTWAVLSTVWSVDRFAAAVTSAHFFAAACLLWAMSQLVRCPAHLRLVGALAFGLLLVLLVQSALYRFMDVPENIAFWEQNKADILKEHNWQPDSFAATQFERKLTSGELVGFFNSANTLAATGVLLFFSCVGIGLQKWKDRESPNWLILSGVAALALLWVLICARSKTSAATPLLGIAGLLVFFRLRRRLTPANHTLHFWMAAAAAGLGIVAVVGHGLYHHGLFPGHFSNSLDFRWKYWVASAGVFASHPWVGVGYSNFGYYYLAHRLPEAAEEIKDPHNFLVRFLVELGLVGGSLCIAWLLRLFYELTLPGGAGETSPGESSSLMTIRSIPLFVIAGMLLSIAANTDFSLGVGDTIALLLKPLLYMLALLLGTMAASMLTQHSWSLDSRAAPIVWYCAVTGLVLFLLHNLIDFSFFEVGPMFLFMTLLGSAQGVSSLRSPGPTSRRRSAIAAIAATIVWISAAVFLVVPVLVAEQAAGAANELIRTASKTPDSQTASHFRLAQQSLATASHFVPYNSDYVFRQAELFLRLGDLDQAKSLISQCKQINPRLIDSYLLEANFQLSQPNPDVAIVRSDFQTILQLNPNDISFHLQYASALQRFGQLDEARAQYQQALSANNALPPGEPKRLSPQQVEDIEGKI